MHVVTSVINFCNYVITITLAKPVPNLRNILPQKCFTIQYEHNKCIRLFIFIIIIIIITSLFFMLVHSS